MDIKGLDNMLESSRLQNQHPSGVEGQLQGTMASCAPGLRKGGRWKRKLWSYSLAWGRVSCSVPRSFKPTKISIFKIISFKYHLAA